MKNKFNAKAVKKELLRNPKYKSFLAGNSQAKKNKVLVIGLDGADPVIMKHFIEEGRLPALAKIGKEGCYLELESTVPPTTAVAWPAFITGRNPGQTGICGFFQPQSERFVESYDVPAPKLWDVISEFGKNSVIINLPMSHPPSRLKGFMVTDFMAMGEEDFTYPGDLTPVLLKNNFRLPATNLKSYRQKDINRFELSEVFLKSIDWDFFCVVFTFIDRVCHLSWNKDEQQILPAYELLDGMVGDLLKDIDEDTTVVVMSDHGFCLWSKRFSVSNFLESLELLKYRSAYGQAKKVKFALLHKLVIKSIKFISRKRRLKEFFRYIKKMLGLRVLHTMPTGRIPDWANTRVYSLNSTANYGLLRINLKGRDPFGIVEEKDFEGFRRFLKEKLQAIRDPDTGGPIVKKVFFSEELFSGERIHLMPDVVFELNEDYLVFDKVEEDLYDVKSLISASDVKIAHHRKESVLMMCGKNICGGASGKARIEDLFATVLYLLDLPLPAGIDGKVLTAAIDNEVLKKQQIREYIPKVVDEVVVVQKTKADSKVAEELKNLGYL